MKKTLFTLIILIFLQAGFATCVVAVKFANLSGLLYLQSGEYEKAIERYRKDLHRSPNNSIWHTGLGRAYLKLERFEKAIVSFKEALRVDPNSASAQFLLGLMYDNGHGIPQNYQEAVKWYRLAAEQGFPMAQYNLGVMYDNGHGIPQNYQEAVKWYRLAAEQSHSTAQFNLGLMYEKGLGVPKDYQEAVKWYQLANEQGHYMAPYFQGPMYLNYHGERVPLDNKGAVKWWHKVAEQGYAKAQFNLGVAYDNGRSVPQDYVSAFMWFNLSAMKGYKAALHSRKLIAGKMTSDQIALAQDMTQQWTAKHGNGKQEPQSGTLTSVPEEKHSIMTAGTGFSLGSSSYIITNYHVVKDANQINVKYLNGNLAKAEVIVKDESSDIVFLKPEQAPKLPGANISLGNSSEMRIGDKVFTIGFPMSNILGHQPGYSEGVINSLAGVGDDPKTFRISIPIQSGNSGGPLFNQKGEVVGIVSSSLDSANTFQVFGNAPQNVNFAVKSTFVKNLLPMIPDALISPTDIVVVPKDSGSLSGFIERVQNNIVLIEAEY